MKKSTPFLFLAVLLLAAMLMGCGNPFISGVGKGAVYGRVYNGMTRALITSTTNTGLAGKLTYYDVGKKTSNTVAAKFNGDFYYFAEIPTLTPYVIEFSDGTSFRTWFYEDANGIAEQKTSPALGETWFVGTDPAKLGNVYLYPASITPGDITVKIIDASNNSVIGSVGTVQLIPQSTLSYDNTDATNVFANGADSRTPVVTGTLAAGSVTFTGATLTLGVTYTVKVYGVTGYSGISVGQTVTADTASAITKNVTLTQIATALSLVSKSNIDSLGNTTVVGNSVTFNFNQDIELDPNTQYTAAISSRTTNDTDDDGTLIVLAAFTGNADAPTPVASNHLTVTVAGNALTVTLKTGCFSTDDTADDLTVAINAASIALRAKGATSRYLTLSDTSLLNAATYSFDVRKSTILE